EQAGAFEHDVDAQLAPRQFRRVALGANLDAIAVDHEVARLDHDFTREAAMHGVVAGQVRVGFRIAEVVDRDHADLVVALRFVQRAQHVAADAAIAVDGDLDSHGATPVDLVARKSMPPGASLRWRAPGGNAYFTGPVDCAHGATSMEPIRGPGTRGTTRVSRRGPSSRVPLREPGCAKSRCQRSCTASSKPRVRRSPTSSPIRPRRTRRSSTRRSISTRPRAASARTASRRWWISSTEPAGTWIGCWKPTRMPTTCPRARGSDRKSTRLNSSHVKISYAVFCLKK